MKMKSTVVLLGLALLLPAAALAGGRGSVLFTPVKSTAELSQLKAGDAMVKVCRACDKVTLTRIPAGGRAASSLYVPKCESCGSDKTYAAVAIGGEDASVSQDAK
jgi:hypothetical protein